VTLLDVIAKSAAYTAGRIFFYVVLLALIVATIVWIARRSR
jgi:hypothetical protein